MSCICVDYVAEERALCLCEVDTQPISTSQRDLIAAYTSQLLIGLGKIIISHPDVKSQIDAHTGERLIDLGQKLHNPTRTSM